jgi:hypothetical protein
MTNGCTQIFQVPASATWRAAPCCVLAAAISCDLGEFFITPELVEPLQAPISLIAIAQTCTTIPVINKQYVGNLDILYVADSADWLVFCGDVARELVLRLANFVRRTSCGDMALTVNDDPT